MHTHTLTTLWQLESYVEFTASNFDDAWLFVKIDRNTNITVPTNKGRLASLVSQEEDGQCLLREAERLTQNPVSTRKEAPIGIPHFSSYQSWLRATESAPPGARGRALPWALALYSAAVSRKFTMSPGATSSAFTRTRAPPATFTATRAPLAAKLASW